MTAGSPDVAGHARTWQRLTGLPLAAAEIERGYRWAALQIPVQYLPWTAGYRYSPPGPRPPAGRS